MQVHGLHPTSQHSGWCIEKRQPFLTSSVCTVPSWCPRDFHRQVDQVCSLAVFSSASGTGFLGFLLVSQTCLAKSQVKVPIPVSGAWHFSRTYSWWLWCSQVGKMHIDEREKSRVQECTRELASSAFIWPHINSIHEFSFLFRLGAFKRNPIDIQMWALAGSNARRS